MDTVPASHLVRVAARRMTFGIQRRVEERWLSAVPDEADRADDAVCRVSEQCGKLKKPVTSCIR